MHMKKTLREIEKIKERNIRVEADKAWETSKTRKVLISILTYCAVVIFFVFLKLPNPFVNAIVPAAAFILSTLSLPIFKKVWIRYIYEKKP